MPYSARSALIVSLIGVAGLYLLQKAEFLFAAQIILYIGGIMLCSCSSSCWSIWIAAAQ